MLRIAEMDWKRRKKKEDLDKLGRAKPSQWLHYSNAIIVIKIIRDGLPRDLHQSLMETHFEERRKPGMNRFYESSLHKIGKQSICNRVGETFKNLNFNQIKIDNNQLRLNLKKAFNFGVNH